MSEAVRSVSPPVTLQGGSDGGVSFVCEGKGGYELVEA